MAQPVAVKVESRPVPELLRCAARPDGFPLDQVAQLSTPIRSAIYRLARAFAANAAQLDRLVNWHDPTACPAPLAD